MPTPKDFPSIWTTWLAKLLVGDNSCEWAAWFKAHYYDFAKAPSDFDSVTWKMNHTALLQRTKERFRKQEYAIYTENQNKFSLPGKTAILSGKPDLICIGDTSST